MKKLKELSNKNYNVLFHTHTVAGIVISFALFVIFYAGAFSLFKHEIAQWENPEMRQPFTEELNLDEGLKKVDEAFGGLVPNQDTNIWLPHEGSPLMYIYGAAYNPDSTTSRIAAYVNPIGMRVQDINKPLTTVGDTIYYLHYFRQIPVVGLYLSGFVALFFLFAIVTGVLIHWRNLLTKFYAFVKEGKWKTIWTNAHTVLGVIGLPFQLMYAITGAFFGLLIFILLPAALVLYGGDANAIYNKVEPASALKTDAKAPTFEHKTLTELAALISSEYPDHELTSVSIRNYGKEDAIAVWNIDHEGIFSNGNLAMRMKDGVILEDYSTIPEKRNYSYSVIGLITKLHFGTFGGNTMRIIYFILSMITCFMIITGILIWRTARDNAKYTLKQRLFHHRVTKFYLAVCLSLFPAFALIFIANKWVPIDVQNRATMVNQIFFLGWLGLTVAGLFWNSYAKQNRNYLFLGGVLSLFVPISNGLVTGDWFWTAWKELPKVASVDIFWLILGVTSLILVFKVLKVSDKSDKPMEIKRKIRADVAEGGYPQKTVKPRVKPQPASHSTNS